MTGALSNQGRSRFAVLDGLRGIAAIAVMIFHYEQASPSSWFIASHGFLAVDFFFLLSGFVICHAYEIRLSAGLPLGRFFLVRVIRLYPLLVVGVLASFVMRALYAHAHGQIPLGRAQWPTLILSLLGLPDFSQPPGSEFLLLPPRWSLFYELAINLIYAAFITLLTNRVVVLLIAVSGTALIWLAHQTGVETLSVAVAVSRTTFSFLVGVMIYRLYRAGKLISVSIPTWLIALMIILAFSVPRGTEFDFPLAVACIYILFPLSVIAACQQRVLGFQARAAEVLGDLSYPLYVIHYPAVFIFAFIFARVEIPSGIRIPLTVVILLMVCSVILRVYDEPARAFLSRRFVRRPPAEPEETAP